MVGNPVAGGAVCRAMRLLCFFPVLIFVGIQWAAAQGVAPSESFGDEGLVVLDIPNTPPDLFIYDVDATADGGFIFSGGRILDGMIRYFISKRGPDGSPISSFGVNGEFTSPASFGPLNGRIAETRNDGSVQIAGFYSYGGVFKITTMRVDPTGQPDPGFGDGGLTVLESNMEIIPCDIALATDGSSYISGRVGGYAFVIHLTANGEMDPDFGEGGMALISSPTGHAITAGRIEIAPTGYVIVSGSNYEQNCQGGFIAALDLAGQPLIWFGDQGYLELDLDQSGQEYWLELTVLTDGGIVASGSITGNGSASMSMILSLSPDGSRNTVFGTNGLVLVQDPSNTSRTAAIPYQMMDGGLVLTGIQLSSNGLLCKLYLIRLRPDGSLDTAFGNGGTYLYNTPQFSFASQNMGARLTDGRIILAAYGFQVNDNGYGVMAYEVEDLAMGRPESATSPAPYAFPNPTTGSITLVNWAGISGSQINMHSSDGKLVQAWSSNSAHSGTPIDLNIDPALPNGSYLLKGEAPDAPKVRVLVQR